MAGPVPKIRDVFDKDIPSVIRFLESHLETSLFLLNNLVAYGHRLSEEPYSGNFRLIEAAGRIVGIFVMTRRGIVLAQTAGRTDMADDIVRGCRRDALPMLGVTGEWNCASAIWARFKSREGFTPTLESREALYRLGMASPGLPEAPAGVRRLHADDFDRWFKLDQAYRDEAGVPALGSSSVETQKLFTAQVSDCRWWGRFVGARLVALAGLNATYKRIGQVGGVYTPPGERRKGYARDVMDGLLFDCIQLHRMDRLILFTDEHNVAARRLYESMGFDLIGAFGLLFGEEH